MTFFAAGTTALDGQLYHHTGTMLKFTRAQAALLPRSNETVRLVLPDGTAVTADFTATAAFPYLHGPPLVRWIKRLLAFGAGQNVRVVEVGRGRLIVSLVGVPVVPAPVPEKGRVRRSLRRLGRITSRTRKSYERWERNPALRKVVLAVWPAQCQVDGCDLATRGAGTLADRVVDVHHLRSVSNGGSDSALNLCVLCVMHHSVIHRAPASSVEATESRSARIRVDGLALDIRRDVFALMAAIES
jgi:hypothetical protein